jgi:hypothetical protein
MEKYTAAIYYDMCCHRCRKFLNSTNSQLCPNVTYRNCLMVVVQSLSHYNTADFLILNITLNLIKAEEKKRLLSNVIVLSRQFV